jgi:hypothetical protein
MRLASVPIVRRPHWPLIAVVIPAVAALAGPSDYSGMSQPHVLLVSNDSLLRGTPGDGGRSWKMDLSLPANNGPVTEDYRIIHVTVNPGAASSRIDWRWSGASYGNDFINMELQVASGYPNFSDCAKSLGVSTQQLSGTSSESFTVPSYVPLNGNSLYHTLTFSGTLLPSGQNIADYGDTALAQCATADNVCHY